MESFLEPAPPLPLERGERSERALKLAVAQMYVEGDSTRKVTKITRELCGLEVTSSQVSRAAKLLDEEIAEWRETIRDIFNAPNRCEADRLLALAVERYQPEAPDLATWMEGNIPEGLAVFEQPSGHRRRLRTSNALERLSREIKRRTRVATLFPNEASLLRLVSAVAIEISEDCETGRTYLSMDTE